MTSSLPLLINPNLESFCFTPLEFDIRLFKLLNASLSKEPLFIKLSTALLVNVSSTKNLKLSLLSAVCGSFLILVSVFVIRFQIQIECVSMMCH